MRKFLLIIVIFSSIFIIDQAWALDPDSFEDFFEDPIDNFFSFDGSGYTFLMFIIGIAIYALFVWYFYRFISRRDLLPKKFYKYSKEENPSIVRRAGYVVIYGISFPIIIFIWFTVLAFFVYLIAEGMPMYLAIFVSMSIIAVVRILSYYREEAGKEIAKMIPYAILAFFLTSAAVYEDPNFFTVKDLGSTPFIFIENIEGIVFAVIVVSIFEFGFRIAFIVKRRFRPKADKKLEDEVDESINEKLTAHYKKLEDKERELEKKIENKILDFKKMEDKERELEKKLEDIQKKIAEEREKV